MALLQPSMRKRLDTKLRRLNALRPLPVSAVQKLREQFQIEMTYHTNAIEGNSLTLKETFLVVNEGLTVKGKPLKDHLEAKSHQAALEYLYDLIAHDRNVTVSERLVRQLHQLVMQDVDKEWAGIYRNGLVMITGTKHRPPDALDVPKKMHELVAWIGRQKYIHPIELASIAHHKLAAIHPFFDGNGRTARLLMNVLLMRKGFPLTIILKNDRKKYYRVLSRADDGDLAPLTQFVAQTIERSLDMYLRALEPTTVKSERYVSLEKLSHGTSYSAKYLNLLTRTGRLEAHKDGRNWVTTKEALKRYENGRLRKRG
ncbi:Fic family protein [Candidatus Uhrbacteria bacterium]|nr:Fic family protein [Candidatus Uhrbacteria bacterium]